MAVRTANGEPTPGKRERSATKGSQARASLSLALEALREVRSGFDFPAELGNITTIGLHGEALTKAHAAWTRARAVLDQLEEGERCECT